MRQKYFEISLLSFIDMNLLVVKIPTTFFFETKISFPLQVCVSRWSFRSYADR